MKNSFCFGTFSMPLLFSAGLRPVFHGFRHDFGNFQLISIGFQKGLQAETAGNHGFRRLTSGAMIFSGAGRHDTPQILPPGRAETASGRVDSAPAGVNTVNAATNMPEWR